MSARFSSVSDRLSLIAGAAAGSVVRNVIFDVWPSGTPLLVSSVVATAVVFLVSPVVQGFSAVSVIRYFVVGVCLATASLSAYALYGIWQTPILALGFVILPTVAALVGLSVGYVLVDVARRVSRRDGVAP